MLQTQNPYSPERISALTSSLAGMTPQARQAYAAQHKNDPAVIAVALNVNNILSAAERNKAMQAGMGAKPTVVDQEIAGMAPPTVAQLPENMGIGQLPAPNIQRMADGGIAGYGDDANEGMGMADGGSMFDFSQRSEPVLRMAGGGMKKLDGADLFEAALDMEGVDDPVERAFLKSVHRQESSGKATEKTSNRGAAGAMQIMPETFKSVADPDMDINKPLDNMRAGIRYGRQGFSAAKGDPVLAGAYYYGGPGGFKKAAQGVAVADPKNPNAPTTIGYGKSVAQRMTDLLPIGSAQAATPTAPANPAEAQAASDREAMLGTVKKMGAAGYDIATLLPRGAMGAFESAVTRPLNALGVPVPYLPESAYGGDRSSMTPAYDALRRQEAAAAQQPAAAAKAVTPDYSANNQSAAETARLLRQNTPPDLQKAAIATAKEEIPKDTLLGFGRDDVIMFGLQLLASKSPNPLQAAGEAGIGMYAAKQAREKAALDKELVQAHKDYYKSSAAKTQAEADYMASGAKGMAAVTAAADKIFDNLTAGMSTYEKMNMSPEKRQQLQNQALAQAAKLYKIELPEGMGTPAAPSSDPLGILSKKG